MRRKIYSAMIVDIRQREIIPDFPDTSGIAVAEKIISEFLMVPINSPATIVKMKTANRMMIALFGLCIR